LTYLAAEVGTCFFDVALLAGVLGTSATRRPPAARGPMTVPTSRSIPPLPLFPLLAQGFALLSAFGVQVPPSVSSNRLLAPSLWTMFEPPAVSQLRAAIVRKEIP